MWYFSLVNKSEEKRSQKNNNNDTINSHTMLFLYNGIKCIELNSKSVKQLKCPCIKDRQLPIMFVYFFKLSLTLFLYELNFISI